MAKHNKNTHFSFSDKKVLIIEDSIMIIQSLRGVLREIGFVDINVHHSETASKALHMCGHRNYDCILCDYNLLQGLNGRQVFEEIQFHKLQSIDTAFIMITGESRRTIVNGIVELNPDEYILKPYTFRQLTEKVSRSIQRRHTLMPVLKAMAKKEYELALSECERLICLQVGFQSDLNVLKGKLLLLLERADEAKQLYSQLTKEKSGLWSRLGLANSMAALEEFDDAKSLLQELLEENDQQIATLTTAANIHLQNNEIPSAIEYFKLASEISPTNPDRELVTANLCNSVGDYTSALGHYSRFLDLSLDTYRETAQAHLNPIRNTLYMAEQQRKESLEESIKLAEQARQQLANYNQNHYDPDFAGDIAAIYAHIALVCGFTTKAVGLLKTSIKERNVEDFYSRFHLATIFVKFGFEKHYLSAINVCKKLIKQSKDKIVVQSQIAMLKALQEKVSKRNEKIVEEIEQGKVAEQQGKWKEAQSYYLNIQQESPYLPDVNFGLLKTLAHAWPANMSKTMVKKQLQHCDTVIELFITEQRRNELNYTSISALAWKNYGLKK